ncbi:hypothetical protein [Halalkalicoccus sp. NIPERK01]|uniref:hypothetical protein n=1 Tax=Halalkalicoccus sp. NIPERK01 TaxID=3053469 RepID=UPI00256F5875|nr:hypothetical protein [Halalkalicoccus sp. NIPERK01]MDL5360648.1 hypothetical protein [Halalkalicoccus sp. NIPERK01]
MSQRERRSFVVCEACDVSKEVDDPNEAVAFYRRHRSITGHDVAWGWADFDGLESSSEDDLASVIAGLEDRFEDGVPLGIVSAAMADAGRTIGETLEAIRSLRMDGELYEPRDDHIRVT